MKDLTCEHGRTFWCWGQCPWLKSPWNYFLDFEFFFLGWNNSDVAQWAGVGRKSWASSISYRTGVLKFYSPINTQQRPARFLEPCWVPGIRDTNEMGFCPSEASLPGVGVGYLSLLWFISIVCPSIHWTPGVTAPGLGTRDALMKRTVPDTAVYKGSQGWSFFPNPQKRLNQQIFKKWNYRKKRKGKQLLKMCQHSSIILAHTEFTLLSIDRFFSKARQWSCY